MVALREEEIDPVRHFFDIDCFFVSALLEDELFEVEECALVRDFLPHLNNSAPCVVGVGFGALGTLSVLLHELDLEGLLEDGALEGFLLDGDLQSYSS